MNTVIDSLSNQDRPSSLSAQDSAALAARLLLAALFIIMGAGKIGAADMMIGYIASVGLPFAEVIYYATVALELIGGIFLAVGYKTRIVAGAIGLFSIAAAVLFHADFANQAEFTNFLKNLSIAGGMLMVVAFGPGRLSIDRR